MNTIEALYEIAKNAIATFINLAMVVALLAVIGLAYVSFRDSVARSEACRAAGGVPVGQGGVACIRKDITIEVKV